MTRRAGVLFVAMCVLWGVPYLLISVADSGVSAPVLVFGRTAIGAAVLLPLAAAGGRLRLPRRAWPSLLLYTVAEIGVPWMLLSDAERHLASSVAGLLVAAVPLVGTAINRAAGGRERIERRQLAGMVVGLAGVGALVGLRIGVGQPRALAEMAVVVVGYAIGPLVLDRRLGDLPATGVMATSLAVCALAYAPAAALTLPAHVPSAQVLGALVGLGLACTALAFVLFFHLIAEIGPVRSTVITYVNPAVAVLLGVAVAGERFTPGMGLGFALIVVGSVLASRRLPAPALRLSGPVSGGSAAMTGVEIDAELPLSGRGEPPVRA